MYPPRLLQLLQPQHPFKDPPSQAVAGEAGDGAERRPKGVVDLLVRLAGDPVRMAAPPPANAAPPKGGLCCRKRFAWALRLRECWSFAVVHA